MTFSSTRPGSVRLCGVSRLPVMKDRKSENSRWSTIDPSLPGRPEQTHGSRARLPSCAATQTPRRETVRQVADDPSRFPRRNLTCGSDAGDVNVLHRTGYYVVPKADLTRARWDRRLLRGTLFPLAFQGTMSCLVMRWRFVEDLRGEIVAPGRRPFPGFPDFSKRGRGDGLGDGLLAAYVPARCNQDPGRRCRLGEGFPHPPSDFSLPFHRDRWRATRLRSLAPGSRPDDRRIRIGRIDDISATTARSPGVR